MVSNCIRPVQPTHQVQSYYGASLAAKRFEVTPDERELQLPEGIVRAWNDMEYSYISLDNNERL